MSTTAFISPMSVFPMATEANVSHLGALVDNDTFSTTSPPNGVTQKNMEDYTLFKVLEIMSSYYLWVIFAVGVPGNIASIFTIVSMPTVSSSKAHVAILALADTLAIILKIIYSQTSKERVKITAAGCTILMFLQQFFSTYVNWVVVAMTIERFVAVWFPLRVGRIYTRKMALGVLALFAAITSGVLFVNFFGWTEMFHEEYGYWCTVIENMSDFFSKEFYWIESIYTSILPCCLVLAGNVLIITNIRRARNAQRHLTNSYDQGGRKAKDQRQITIMLVVVSVVFLILNMPNAVCYIIKPEIQGTFVRGSYEHLKYRFIYRFVQVLTDLNHAVNFYLYFLSMASFRRRFMDAIRCRKSARRRPTGSVYRTSQTYVHSAPMSETSRTEMSTRYITPSLKRNGSNAESHHSLKSCSSGNNARLSIHTDNSSHVTANSEV